MAEADPRFVDRNSAFLANDQVPDEALPAPPRSGCSVKPLIEAADMYPELEHLVLDARKSVWFSFRIFDPDTATRSERARSLGLHNWISLIGHAVRRGVEVRILLADFEPVLADHLHAGSWHSFRRLRELSAELDEEQRPLLQLMVVQHEGEIGWCWRQLLRPLLRGHIRRLVEKLLRRGNNEDGGFDTRPGLWRHLAWENKRPTAWKPAPSPHLWPATYHQKVVVVDGRSAIIGGLDLDERRWDDRRHRQRANETWHDVSALIQGPVVEDAAHHFAALWNRELPRYRQIVNEWTSSCGQILMVDPLSRIDAVPRPVKHSGGEATVQLVRTLSRNSRSPFAMGPRRYVREIKAAHRTVIGSARRLLYIEAQFFRSKETADWIEAALAANPKLEVIILIANAPEEIAFEGQTSNLAHRHGEHLQARALGALLRKAGPRRVGLFTLTKHAPVMASEQKFEATRGTAYGSGLIHIHSKLVMADEELCLLSSANINGRSFEWDTELGFIWSEEGNSIAEFRKSLWWQLFGGCLPEQMNLEGWRDAARFNSSVEPHQRKGFVLPYQLGRARRFSRPYWFIPDDLV